MANPNPIISDKYLKRLAEIESSNNPNARAKTSSAVGLYQFTKGTWKDLVKKYGLDYTLEDRTDPKKSREVVKLFTKENSDYLRNALGRNPSEGELYLAHFLGRGGAKKLLAGEGSLDKLVGPASLNANKSIFYDKEGRLKKKEDIINWANSKMSIANSNYDNTQFSYPSSSSSVNLNTASSVDPSLITNNPYLNQEYKQQLLSRNEQGQGISQQDTSYLKQTADTKAYAPLFNPPKNELSNPKMEGDRKSLGYTGEIGAFPSDFKLLNGSFNQGGFLDEDCPDCPKQFDKLKQKKNYRPEVVKSSIPTPKIRINDLNNKPTYERVTNPKTDKVEIPYREIQNKDCGNDYGCVKGAIVDMSRTLGVNMDQFRKENHMFGDAWDIIDNTYGEIITPSNDYSNVKPGDILSLNRNSFDSDIERGIPEKEQHFGWVVRKDGDIPIVRHYINSKNDYYEEPINNISSFAKYDVSRIKRPSYAKDIDISTNIAQTPFYTHNEQSNEVISTINSEAETIQKTLRLDAKEFDRLSKLAYGIIGAESDFGESKRTLFRMAVPDFIQKEVKKSRNNYDEHTNPLSKGYSSVKSSSMFNISDDRDIDIKEIQKQIGLTGEDIDGIWGKKSATALKEYQKAHPEFDYKSLNEKLSTGDYRDLSKNQNYNYTMMNKLGLNSENLESPGNAYKATMIFLAKELKENPNISEEELLQKYQGKKENKPYAKRVNEYINNLDNNPDNDIPYSFKDNMYGKLSGFANEVNEAVKNTKSKITETISKNTKDIPINLRALGTAMTGADFDFTEEHLNEESLEYLSKIVLNNISKNKFNIEYGDYGNKAFADVGGPPDKGTLERIKNAFTQQPTILKQFLGQANIVDKGNGVYEITDTYDFNDEGESFGIIDDLIKRGPVPYNIARSIGRNYGKGDGQGNKVKITIDTKEYDNENSKFELGGYLEKNCGGPGQPPCKDLIVKSKNDPRYKAYQDSLLVYNTDKKLTERLIEDGYKYKKDTKENKKTHLTRIEAYANKKGNIKIDSVEGRDDLFTTPDYYASVIVDKYGKQYLSKNIIPEGMRHFGKWVKQEGDFLPSYDLRKTANYSNAKPKQKVIVEEKKKQAPQSMLDELTKISSKQKELNNYTTKIGDKWYDPNTKAYQEALKKEKSNKETNNAPKKEVEKYNGKYAYRDKTGAWHYADVTNDYNSIKTYEEAKSKPGFRHVNKEFANIRASRRGGRKNPDGTVSTHLMADNDKDTAFPTLFQNKDGSWDDLSNDHDAAFKRAKKDNEIYTFPNREDLINFARKGSWKNNQFESGGLLEEECPECPKIVQDNTRTNQRRRINDLQPNKYLPYIPEHTFVQGHAPSNKNTLSNELSDFGTRTLNAVKTFGTSAIGDAIHGFSPRTAEKVEEYSGGFIPYTKQEELVANRSDNPNKLKNRTVDATEALIYPALELATEGLVSKGVINSALKSLKPSESVKNTLYKIKNVKNDIDAKRYFKKQIKWLETEEGKKRLRGLGITPKKYPHFIERMKSIELELDPSYGGSFYQVSKLGRPKINVNHRDLKDHNISNKKPYKQIIDHELGHAFQDINNTLVYRYPKKSRTDLLEKNPITGTYSPNFKKAKSYSTRDTEPTWVDIELDKLELKHGKDPVPFKKLLGPEKDPTLAASDYFNRASGRYGTEIDNKLERLPFLREYRQTLFESGLIKNKYDDVTDEIITKFYKKNPKNRLNRIMVNNQKNRDILKNVLKYAPVGAVPLMLNNNEENPNNMKNSSFKEGGLINKFNEGGTHEESPHGGIPLSKNAQGGNNLVEQGETKYGNYIFSNSIKLDKKTAKRFHINKKYVGKTMAEISERYNAEIEDRPFDKIAVGTAKKELDKLMLVNEELRPKDPSSEQMDPMQQMGPMNEMNNGGNINQPQNGFYNSLLGNTVESGDTFNAQMNYLNNDNKFWFGGMYNHGGFGNGATSTGSQGLSNNQMSTIGMAGNAAGHTLNRNQNDSVIAGNPKDNATIDTTKDVVATAIGPIGQMFRGIQKMGQGIGNTIGGDVGAGVADGFSPEESTMSIFTTNKDASIDEKIALSMPITGGIAAKKLKERRENEENFHRVGALNNYYRESDFKNGGMLNKSFDNGGYTDPEEEKKKKEISYGDFLRLNFPDTDPIDFTAAPINSLNLADRNNYLTNRYESKEGENKNTMSGKFLRGTNPDTNEIDFNPAGISGLNVGGSESPFAIQKENEYNVNQNETVNRFGDISKGIGNKLGKAVGKYGNDVMRLAPIARNLLKKEETAETHRYNRLRDKYQRSTMDHSNMYNRVNNASGNARAAARDASGGSSGRFSNDLKQIHLNELQSISDILFKNQNFDAQQNQIAQSFDKDTNMRNQIIDMREQTDNAGNRAATQAYNDAYKDAAWDDIGLFGRENKTGDMFRRTTGYNPDGTKEGTEENYFRNLFRGYSAQQQALEEEKEKLRRKFNQQ